MLLNIKLPKRLHSVFICSATPNILHSSCPEKFSNKENDFKTKQKFLVLCFFPREMSELCPSNSEADSCM